MTENLSHYLFFRPNTDFHLFGSQHLVMIFFTAGLSAVLAVFSKKYLSERQKLTASRVMTVILAVAVLGWIGIRLALGEFDPKTDLPLDICNVLALALPFLMWRPSRRVQEVAYFWILAGTIQAVLTPHLFEGFPHFTFVKYWTVHGGLIVYAVFATVAFGFYPGWKSLWRSFLLVQVYLVALYFINLALGSNYAYIMGKPPTASALDFLGPYPWYLLVGEAIAVVFFVLVYLPVHFSQNITRKG